jgi:hypothetical protein
MNRAMGLATELRSLGFACSVDHDVVTIDDAPAHTEARVHVGLEVDGYLCSFVARPEHVTAWRLPGGRGLAKQWAHWTAFVRACVGAVWPVLEPLEIPEAKRLEPVPLEIRYEHEYPLWLPVDDALVHAYQGAMRERRVVVVQEWRAWGSSDDSGYDAPRVTWHAWAREVAADLGAAVGWAGIEGQTIEAGHPAAPHVQRILVEATRRVETPTGIVALDMRGLTLAAVETLVRALVEDGQARHARGEPARGTIVLCDRVAAVYLWRSVRLTFD